ncbi:MAG TPA: toxin-antitoxin system YwqK family antitoxin [Bacteroidia bacterium]|nr:toxin-antitoxin system YwqK family antitoxin [Bacteroidia bacterium]
MKRNSLLFCCMLLPFILLNSCSEKFDGKNGKRTVYFEGTEKVSQSVEYKNGKKNGWWLEFYENGNPKVKSRYVNDTLQDSSLYYYKNGKFSDIQVFKNGKREGCWKKFNESGMLYSEINFKNNYKEGVQTRYTYNSGRLLERLNYKNGMPHGKQEYFYNSGKPKSVSYYYSNHPCEGLEEWTEGGRKINNDFKISTREQNRVAMENKLKFNVYLENPKPDDEVSEIFESRTRPCFQRGISYEHAGDHFETGFYVYKRGFVMKKIQIAAFRKTAFGNVMVKKTTFNVSATNF